MKLVDLARINKINLVDMYIVNSIAKDMVEGVFNSPAILYHSQCNQAITGSHRIAAAEKLVEMDNLREDCDFWYSDIEVDVIAVDEYVDEYCEENECTLDQIDYCNLSAIFGNTDIADEVEKNKEW